MRPRRLSQRQQATQRALYSAAHHLVADAARYLGTAVVRIHLNGARHMERLLRQRSSPLTDLVVFVLHVRGGHARHWRTLADVQRALRRSHPGTQPSTGRRLHRRDSPHPRWVRQLLAQVYALHCLLRRRVRPRAVLPRTRTTYRFVPGRALGRQLRQTGFHCGPELWSAARRHDEANDTLGMLWDAIAGRQVVLWLDNYFVPEQATQVLQAPISSSVMAVHLLSTNVQPAHGCRWGPWPPGIAGCRRW